MPTGGSLCVSPPEHPVVRPTFLLPFPTGFPEDCCLQAPLVSEEQTGREAAYVCHHFPFVPFVCNGAMLSVTSSLVWGLAAKEQKPSSFCCLSDVLTRVIQPLFSTSRSKHKLKLIRVSPLCTLEGLCLYKVACLSFPTHSFCPQTTVFLLTHLELQSGCSFCFL